MFRATGKRWGKDWERWQDLANLWSCRKPSHCLRLQWQTHRAQSTLWSGMEICLRYHSCMGNNQQHPPSVPPLPHTHTHTHPRHSPPSSAKLHLFLLFSLPSSHIFSPDLSIFHDDFFFLYDCKCVQAGQKLDMSRCVRAFGFISSALDITFSYSRE